jgi:autotransporter-associated beta strand protein
MNETTNPHLSSLRALLFSGALLLLSVVTLRADSATWNLNPTNGDWNTAANWTPATVPNGGTDIATFASSSATTVTLSTNIRVGEIVFDAGASPFTISVVPFSHSLFVSGPGITNGSGVTQNLTTENSSTIQFENNAIIGDLVTITNRQNTGGTSAAKFLNNSSAGESVIVNEGAAARFNYSGFANFLNNSNAGNATINNKGASPEGPGGFTYFTANSSAGNATFNNTSALGGTLGGAGNTRFVGSATADHGTFFNGTGQGETHFYDGSSAANGVFTNYGGDSINIGGGRVFFFNHSHADQAHITNLGGDGSGSFAFGAGTYFYATSQAEDVSLLAKGGRDSGNGGEVFFYEQSNGGRAQIELHGNAKLDISNHDAPGLKLGSIEGDGNVFLGGLSLTVGTNNLDTVFFGVIQDGGSAGGTGGSLAKVGTGRLVLTGANTYTGGTTVTRGFLFVNNTTGSGAGTGPVTVDAGALGGSGIISGAVTLGTGTGSGAYLAPGKANAIGTLTLNNTLTFLADATYDFDLNSSRATADNIIAKGITISNGTVMSMTDKGVAPLPIGTVLTALSNTATTPINGTFANLADGATITIGNNKFQASYEGGDGNDLTLTVIP